MCPFNKQCAAVIGGIMACEILICSIREKQCDYYSHNEHLPHQEINYPEALHNANHVIVSGTASTISGSTYLGTSPLNKDKNLWAINLEQLSILP